MQGEAEVRKNEKPLEPKVSGWVFATEAAAAKERLAFLHIVVNASGLSSRGSDQFQREHPNPSVISMFACGMTHLIIFIFAL
jgi:hypothetical protein